MLANKILGIGLGCVSVGLVFYSCWVIHCGARQVESKYIRPRFVHVFMTGLAMAVPPVVFICMSVSVTMVEKPGDEGLMMVGYWYIVGGFVNGLFYLTAPITNDDLDRGVLGEAKRFLPIMVQWPKHCYRYGRYQMGRAAEQ